MQQLVSERISGRDWAGPAPRVRRRRPGPTRRARSRPGWSTKPRGPPPWTPLAWAPPAVGGAVRGRLARERRRGGDAPLARLRLRSRALATVSYPPAIRFPWRISMIHAAVCSHSPLSLLLAALTLVGAQAGAAALLRVARGLRIEMGVPARQPCISGAVAPEERADADGITSSDAGSPGRRPWTRLRARPDATRRAQGVGRRPPNGAP